MNLFHKVRYFLLKKRNPIQYARKLGVTIGENCRLIGSPNWGSEPWLITLGNHTEVSCDCAFITHDGATQVFRNEEKYKNVVKFGKINIGNDCFIGARSTIMPGISIGDKAIVAACSLVNKSIPSGEIWRGFQHILSLRQMNMLRSVCKIHLSMIQKITRKISKMKC